MFTPPNESPILAPGSRVVDFNNPLNPTHPLNAGLVARYDFRFYNNGRPTMKGLTPYEYWNSSASIGADGCEITRADVRPGGGASFRLNVGTNTGNAIGLTTPNIWNYYIFTCACWFKILTSDGGAGIWQYHEFGGGTNTWGANCSSYLNSTTLWQPQLHNINYQSWVQGQYLSGRTSVQYALPMQDWHHIVWTNQNVANSARCWLDGVEVPVTYSHLYRDSQYKGIGQSYNTGYQMRGYIDDFRWWGYRMEPSLAATIYETSRQQFDPTLNWVDIGTPEYMLWGALAGADSVAPANNFAIIHF